MQDATGACQIADAGPELFSGVRVNLRSSRHAIDTVLQRLRAGLGFQLFTLNLDHIAKLRQDAAFLGVYRGADLVSADGWPVVWRYRRSGVEIERTTGADLVEPLCRGAADENFPVYFLGPLPAVQARAIDVLCNQSPRLQVAGAEAPMIATGDERLLDEIAARINASGARLCFVALGAPKQEFVAAALAGRCSRVGFLCVGAALDFLAGDATRAPVWVQRAGCEWLWRLALDPRRLLMRYVASIYVLILMALGRDPVPDRRSTKRPESLDRA